MPTQIRGHVTALNPPIVSTTISAELNSTERKALIDISATSGVSIELGTDNGNDD